MAIKRYAMTSDEKSGVVPHHNTSDGRSALNPGDASARAGDYEGRVTAKVVIACFIAATGGMLFGYDLGVTGGVSSFPSFLNRFFPEVLAGKGKNAYCTYNSQKLQIFTSSYFLAGAVAGLISHLLNARLGRKWCMVIAGFWFTIGAVINCAAQDLAMLYLGRILLGFGVGFANQSVPLYLSEIAPPRWRGTLNLLFQCFCIFGILAAACINYGTVRTHWGWRLSLGLAAVPAVVLGVGALFLPDSPNSLVFRGKVEQARKVLEGYRGTTHVDAEFADICDAVAATQRIKHKTRLLLSKKHAPQLTAAILIPAFQQLNGINSITFYAPQLFASIGAGLTGTYGALLSSVVIDAIEMAGTFIGLGTVDKFGRKALLIQGGIQMTICQIVTAVILATKMDKSTGTMPAPAGKAVLAFICLFVAGFSWSWGPLGWLVPSEVHTIETRSPAQGITVCINFLASFLVGQVYLTMLCKMEWGTYLFFAFWAAVMTLYVIFFLPETKGVPLEEMQVLWARHWFWGNFVRNKGQNQIVNSGAVTNATYDEGVKTVA